MLQDIISDLRLCQLDRKLSVCTIWMLFEVFYIILRVSWVCFVHACTEWTGSGQSGCYLKDFILYCESHGCALCMPVLNGQGLKNELAYTQLDKRKEHFWHTALAQMFKLIQCWNIDHIEYTLNYFHNSECNCLSFCLF